MTVRRTRRPYRPRKPARSRVLFGLLTGLLGAAIVAAGAGLLWLAYAWSFDVEANSAVGVSIGNLRFAATDSIDVLGVLIAGFFGLFLVVLGVKMVIGAIRGTGL